MVKGLSIHERMVFTYFIPVKPPSMSSDPSNYEPVNGSSFDRTTRLRIRKFSHPLAADLSICWQVMRDLTAAPAHEVAAERARVATKGWGAQLFSLQGSDGLWGGGAWYCGLDSTMQDLIKQRDLGLDPASKQACRALGLVRDKVMWQGCSLLYCDTKSFFLGEIEPCINGKVGAVGAHFSQDIRGLIDRLPGEQLSDGGWSICTALVSRRTSGWLKQSTWSCRSVVTRTGGSWFNNSNSESLVVIIQAWIGVELRNQPANRSIYGIGI